LPAKNDTMRGKGERDAGETANNKNRGIEWGSVLPEIREEHERQVGAERQVLSGDSGTPHNLREACGREGEGLIHDPTGYASSHPYPLVIGFGGISPSFHSLPGM